MEEVYLKSQLERLFCKNIITDSTNRVTELIEVTEKKILELDKTGSLEFLQMKSSEVKVSFDSIFSSPIDYTIGLNDCLQRHAKKTIRGNELSFQRLNPFLTVISDLKKTVHSALLILDSSKGDYSQIFDLNLTIDTQLEDLLYLEFGTDYFSELEKFVQIFAHFNALISTDLSSTVSEINNRDIKIRILLTELRLIIKELEEFKVMLLEEEVRFIYRELFIKSSINTIVNHLVTFKYSNWIDTQIEEFKGFTIDDIIIKVDQFRTICDDFCNFKELSTGKKFHIISKLQDGSYKWNGNGVKKGIPFLAAFLARLEELKIVKTSSDKRFALVILDYFSINHEGREYKFLLESLSSISVKNKAYFALEIKNNQ